MRPIIDTNILSELMRREPDARVLAWGGKQEGFLVSVITLDELTFGLAKRPLPMKSQWLEEFLNLHCEILAITPAVARCSGAMRGQFAARGVSRHPFDMLIAATALLHKIPLATRNEADFAGCGIQIINPFR